MSEKTVVCRLKRSPNIHVDFTGRWKVVNAGDGDVRLELECFYLGKEVRTRPTGKKEYIKISSPNWFQRMLGQKEVFTFRDEVEHYTKLIRPLGYVNSNEFVLEEIYTNTCGAIDE